MKIHIVSATRADRVTFWEQGALGLSLRRLVQDTRLVPWIAYENKLGLPAVYNQVLTAENNNDAVVFIHDDVWLDDMFFGDRILEALDRFDVVGIAGNQRRQPGQPGWAFVNTDFCWDDRRYLSGGVAHGQSAFGRPTRFGQTPAACELLDGVLLAARISRLNESNCRFDERFMFHFYDLDFCRSAALAGLTMGTWPISVTHQSGGAFGTQSWWQGYRDYVGKWAQ